MSLARLLVIHRGKWKSVSKIKLNFHFAFFPLLSRSECVTCVMVFHSSRQAKRLCLRLVVAGLGNPALCLDFWSHEGQVTYVILNLIYSIYPFPLGKEGWEFPAVRGGQIRQGCVTCWSYESYLGMAELVNSCSPLLSCEWLAFCHTASFNELHLYVGQSIMESRLVIWCCPQCTWGAVVCSVCWAADEGWIPKWGGYLLFI